MKVVTVDGMRAFGVPVIALVAALALFTSGCTADPPAKEYELQGQILAVRPERNEVVIKHGDIKGFMPGMTMPFKVKDAALLEGRQPGDLVTATLVVGEVEAHLSTLAKTGQAPLDAPPPAPASDVRQPGDQLSDATLIDQDAAPRPLSSFRGHRLALTFIYTRCPLPEFCPLMDRNFGAVQRVIASTPALSDVRLVTVTLDPAFDTPAVLKPYSRRREADPKIWSFLTGEPAEVNRFGSQLGVYVEHNPQSAIDITHNLRTAVIDPDGRLVTMHNGNSWTPAELIADLTAVPTPTH
ncbi:MAG TPA: SCO family protein [Vicinamibacterales bacterium]|nr:SCO family protein [Vicinamibacterales bacterium]